MKVTVDECIVFEIEEARECEYVSEPSIADLTYCRDAVVNRFEVSIESPSLCFDVVTDEQVRK